MKSSPEATAKLNRAIKRSLSQMVPPDDLTVSQWAEKKRRLSAEASAEPGPWRNTRTPYLVEVMDAFTDPRVRHIVLVAASQVGKALALDTPIVTPNGWSTMGDLAVGDEVYDENGYPCRVTFATNVMNDHPCYRVTFSDGSEIVADAEHRWAVDRLNDGLREERTIVTTHDMACDYKIGKRNRYAIPVAGALKCGAKDLPIAPYTFGYWIGNGNSYSNQLTVGSQDIEEISHYVDTDKIKSVVRATKKKTVFNILLDPKTKNMDHVPMFTLLNDNGLIGNKHIPQMYMRASYEQRLFLLQGILDSDGSVAKDSGRVEITFKSKRLIDDLHELLLSLGIKNTVKKRMATCTNAKGGPKQFEVYRISFMAYDMQVFRLKRKAKYLKSSSDTGRNGNPLRITETTRRRVINVEPVESVPVRCIQVDSKSHLYLAGRDMIPTHNTECENNMIGYIIDEDPGSILFVHPTVVDAKEFSKLRIAPMLRDTPCLKRKVKGSLKGRDNSQTQMQKTYPGGILTLCGSTEAHALASKPIRYVFGDERDRWAISAGTEGDPWDLAMARQTTFYNAKAVEVSTPTIKGASAIEVAYLGGTMERYCSKCPDCGEYVEIKFKDIRFKYDEAVVLGKKKFTVTELHHVCPECGCIHDEQSMKKAPAKWVAENPDALKHGTRSFWLNAFVSRWASWESIIQKYLNALGSSQKMQVVYNTCFGELWENRGDTQDEDTLMSRREDYEAELPEGVLVLTCGVDTQDNRLEYEVVGHGHFGETWGIKKGVIMGRPDDRATWESLDAVLDKKYEFKDGHGLKIACTFVDEGGHFTQDVRVQTAQRMRKRVFCIKGRGGQDIPYVSAPKKQKIIIENKYIGSCWTYMIGVDSGKQIIMDNLSVQSYGSKYCHFPKNDDYGHQYFEGLLSEKLVYNPNRKNKWYWEKIPGHERNENLDIRNYAIAAFKALSVNLDEQDRKLKEARGKTVLEKKPVVAVPKEQPKPKKKRTVNTKRVYDTW